MIQRVRRAAVSVDGAEVSAIGEGLFVLLGVGREDDEEVTTRLADKISRLRVFDDGSGRLGEALGDREVLCVSQFTLMADTGKGNRPGFGAAARPDDARPLYDLFCERIGSKKGVFGAEMSIDLECQGPVTILLEG